MLYSAVALFAIGLLAALSGYVSVAVAAADIAQVLFVLFVLLSIGQFLLGLRRSHRPVVGR